MSHETKRICPECGSIQNLSFFHFEPDIISAENMTERCEKCNALAAAKKRFKEKFFDKLAVGQKERTGIILLGRSRSPWPTVRSPFSKEEEEAWSIIRNKLKDGE